MTDEDNRRDPSGTGFVRDTGSALAREAWSTLRSILIGAGLGALVLGGAGGYFFGWDGLWIGALAGAAIGGFAVLWLYSEI